MEAKVSSHTRRKSSKEIKLKEDPKFDTDDEIYNESDDKISRWNSRDKQLPDHKKIGAGDNKHSAKYSGTAPSAKLDDPLEAKSTLSVVENVKITNTIQTQKICEGFKM